MLLLILVLLAFIFKTKSLKLFFNQCQISFQTPSVYFCNDFASAFKVLNSQTVESNNHQRAPSKLISIHLKLVHTVVFNQVINLFILETALFNHRAIPLDINLGIIRKISPRAFHINLKALRIMVHEPIHIFAKLENTHFQTVNNDFNTNQTNCIQLTTPVNTFIKKSHQLNASFFQPHNNSPIQPNTSEKTSKIGIIAHQIAFIISIKEMIVATQYC
jgi:hypothetical protein